MSQRRWFFALAVVAGLSTPAFGQDAVTLKWEFQKDKPFYQEMKTTTKQTMKVTGMEISQNQEQAFVFSWTPKEQDKDKNWIINQKIEAIKMEIEMGGNKISYDSAKEGASTVTPLADFFKVLVGSEFKLTVSPDLKILKIEGRDDFMQKLIKANPSMEPLLKQILSDDALKQMADSAFASVPTKPVKKGDTWEKTSKLNMGPIGTYDTTYKYTYEGKEGKFDKIKLTSNLTYQPPAANTAGTLPFKIKDANLKSKKAEGTILFDNEKHRLEKSDLKLVLEGKLTIEIGGTPTEVELNQDQTTTVSTSDTNPVKKEAK